MLIRRKGVFLWKDTYIDCRINSTASDLLFNTGLTLSLYGVPNLQVQLIKATCEENPCEV